MDKVGYSLAIQMRRLRNSLSKIKLMARKRLKLDFIKDNIIFLAVFLYFAFYSSGIINTLLEAGRIPSTVLFTPYKNYQTWIEFIVAVFNFVGGSFGAYLIWKGLNSLSAKDMRINFIIGIALLIISTVIGVVTMYIKYMI